MSNMDPTKTTHALVKGKQFLFLIRHPPCYIVLIVISDILFKCLKAVCKHIVTGRYYVLCKICKNNCKLLFVTELQKLRGRQGVS